MAQQNDVIKILFNLEGNVQKAGDDTAKVLEHMKRAAEDLGKVKAGTLEKTLEGLGKAASRAAKGGFTQIRNALAALKDGSGDAEKATRAIKSGFTRTQSALSAQITAYGELQKAQEGVAKSQEKVGKTTAKNTQSKQARENSKAYDAEKERLERLNDARIQSITALEAARKAQQKSNITAEESALADAQVTNALTALSNSVQDYATRQAAAAKSADTNVRGLTETYKQLAIETQVLLTQQREFSKFLSSEAGYKDAQNQLTALTAQTEAFSSKELSTVRSVEALNNELIKSAQLSKQLSEAQKSIGKVGTSLEGQGSTEATALVERTQVLLTLTNQLDRAQKAYNASIRGALAELTSEQERLAKLRDLAREVVDLQARLKSDPKGLIIEHGGAEKALRFIETKVQGIRKSFEDIGAAGFPRLERSATRFSTLITSAINSIEGSQSLKNISIVVAKNQSKADQKAADQETAKNLKTLETLASRLEKTYGHLSIAVEGYSKRASSEIKGVVKSEEKLQDASLTLEDIQTRLSHLRGLKPADPEVRKSLDALEERTRVLSETYRGLQKQFSVQLTRHNEFQKLPPELQSAGKSVDNFSLKLQELKAKAETLKITEFTDVKSLERTFNALIRGTDAAKGNVTSLATSLDALRKNFGQLESFKNLEQELKRISKGLGEVTTAANQARHVKLPKLQAEDSATKINELTHSLEALIKSSESLQRLGGGGRLESLLTKDLTNLQKQSEFTKKSLNSLGDTALKVEKALSDTGGSQAQISSLRDIASKAFDASRAMDAMATSARTRLREVGPAGDLLIQLKGASATQRELTNEGAVIFRKMARDSDRLLTAFGRNGKAIRDQAADFVGGFRQLEEELVRFRSGAVTWAIGLAALGASVTVPIQQAISLFAQLSDTMSIVGGVTGATHAEFVALEETVSALGAITRFTAQEAAEGMQQLGMAGFNAAQAISALPIALRLAQAAGSQLERVTDIITNIQASFELGADKIGTAADVLTKAFTTTNSTIENLGYSFVYVGSLAKGAGIGFEELTGTLAKLGNVGFKGCYSADTEVLTKDRGFILFKDYREGDEIFTLNPETREMEFMPTVDGRLYEFDVDEDILKLKSKHLDLAVTWEHTMTVEDRNGKFKEIKAHKFKEGKFFRTGAWTGEDYEYHTIKGMTQNRANWKKDIPSVVIPIEDWVAFAGWYVAEGCVDSTHKGGNYRVFLSQLKKNKDFGKLETLLERFPYSFTYNGDSFKVHSQQLWEEVSQFGVGANNKTVPDYIKNLSPRLLRIFLEAFRMGDGDDQFNLYTSSKKLADDLHEISIKAGYGASCIIDGEAGTTVTFGERELVRSTDHYIVRVSTKQTKPFFNHSVHKALVARREEKGTVRKAAQQFDWVPYKGKVYCLSMPYGNMYVRRNGKSCFCGNTLAGTALRGILDTLANPTKQESELLAELSKRVGGFGLQLKNHKGDFVGFVSLVKQMEAAGITSGEALKLFGQRAGPGFSALLRIGSKELESYIEELEYAEGTTARLADLRSKSLGSKIKIAGASLEAVGEDVGKSLEKALAPALEIFSEVIQKFLAVREAGRDVFGLDLTAAIDNTVAGIGALIAALASLTFAWVFMGAPAREFIQALFTMSKVQEAIALLAEGDSARIANRLGLMVDQKGLIVGTTAATQAQIASVVALDKAEQALIATRTKRAAGGFATAQAGLAAELAAAKSVVAAKRAAPTDDALSALIVPSTGIGSKIQESARSIGERMRVGIQAGLKGLYENAFLATGAAYTALSSKIVAQTDRQRKAVGLLASSWGWLSSILKFFLKNPVVLALVAISTILLTVTKRTNVLNAEITQQKELLAASAKEAEFLGKRLKDLAGDLEYLQERRISLDGTDLEQNAREITDTFAGIESKYLKLIDNLVQAEDVNVYLRVDESGSIAATAVFENIKEGSEGVRRSIQLTEEAFSDYNTALKIQEDLAASSAKNNELLSEKIAIKELVVFGDELRKANLGIDKFAGVGVQHLNTMIFKFNTLAKVVKGVFEGFNDFTDEEFGFALGDTSDEAAQKSADKVTIALSARKRAVDTFLQSMVDAGISVEQFAQAQKELAAGEANETNFLYRLTTGAEEYSGALTRFGDVASNIVKGAINPLADSFNSLNIAQEELVDSDTLGRYEELSSAARTIAKSFSLEDLTTDAANSIGEMIKSFEELSEESGDAIDELKDDLKELFEVDDEVLGTLVDFYKAQLDQMTAELDNNLAQRIAHIRKFVQGAAAQESAILKVTDEIDKEKLAKQRETSKKILEAINDNYDKQVDAAKGHRATLIDIETRRLESIQSLNEDRLDVEQGVLDSLYEKTKATYARLKALSDQRLANEKSAASVLEKLRSKEYGEDTDEEKIDAGRAEIKDTIPELRLAVLSGDLEEAQKLYDKILGAADKLSSLDISPVDARDLRQAVTYAEELLDLGVTLGEGKEKSRVGALERETESQQKVVAELSGQVVDNASTLAALSYENAYGEALKSQVAQAEMLRLKIKEVTTESRNLARTLQLLSDASVSDEGFGVSPESLQKGAEVTKKIFEDLQRLSSSQGGGNIISPEQSGFIAHATQDVAAFKDNLHLLPPLLIEVASNLSRLAEENKGVGSLADNTRLAALAERYGTLGEQLKSLSATQDQAETNIQSFKTQVATPAQNVEFITGTKDELSSLSEQLTKLKHQFKQDLPTLDPASFSDTGDSDKAANQAITDANALRQALQQLQERVSALQRQSAGRRAALEDVVGSEEGVKQADALEKRLKKLQLFLVAFGDQVTSATGVEGLKNLIDESSVLIQQTGEQAAQLAQAEQELADASLASQQELQVALGQTKQTFASIIVDLNTLSTHDGIDVQNEALGQSVEKAQQFDAILKTIITKLDAIRAKSAATSGVEAVPGSQEGGPILGFNNGFSVPSYSKVPGTGTGDKVKALLEPGEFIVRRNMVDKYGLSFLNALNQGALQLRQFGGAISSVKPSFTVPSTTVQAFAGGGEVSSNDVVTINLNIGGDRFNLDSPRDQVSSLVNSLKKLGKGR